MSPPHYGLLHSSDLNLSLTFQVFKVFASTISTIVSKGNEKSKNNMHVASCTNAQVVEQEIESNVRQ